MMINDWMVYVIIFVFGALLGSYLNSWMWRVYEHQWVFGGRSKCVHCARGLNWYENIPLFSFLWLKGKCRTCNGKIPSDYFLVELFTPLLLLGITYYHLAQVDLNSGLFFRDFFYTLILIVVFVYDYKYKLVRSSLVWGGVIVGLIFNYKLLLFTPYSLLLGTLVGGGFFLSQYLISRGRWIGGGDVRLGVMMGVWLGWPNILVALFVSYVSGAIVAIPLLVMKKKGMNSEIPFGTFLAVGTLVALFFGTKIIKWYWGLIG